MYKIIFSMITIMALASCEKDEFTDPTRGGGRGRDTKPEVVVPQSKWDISNRYITYLGDTTGFDINGTDTTWYSGPKNPDGSFAGYSENPFTKKTPACYGAPKHVFMFWSDRNKNIIRWLWEDPTCQNIFDQNGDIPHEINSQYSPEVAKLLVSDMEETWLNYAVIEVSQSGKVGKIVTKDYLK